MPTQNDRPQPAHSPTRCVHLDDATTTPRRPAVSARSAVTSRRLLAWTLGTTFALASAMPGPATAEPFEDCQLAEGVAVHGAGGAVSAGNGSAFVFGGPLGGAVLCNPPTMSSTELVYGGSAARVAFTTGAGGYFDTLASVAQDDSDARAWVRLDFAYPFRVVPDDPLSTAPVEISIITRHRTSTDISVAGGASASNSLSADYAIGNGYTSEPGFFQQWSSGGAPPVPNGYFDIVHTAQVPVNTVLNFRARLQPQSYASDGNLANPGGGGAGMRLLWTFAAETDAAATIVFDFEDALGLDPPSLDFVPEPGFGTALGGCVLTLAGLRRHSRARPRRVNRS